MSPVDVELLRALLLEEDDRPIYLVARTQREMDLEPHRHPDRPGRTLALVDAPTEAQAAALGRRVV